MNMEPYVLKFSEISPEDRLADSETELPSYTPDQLYAIVFCFLLVLSMVKDATPKAGERYNNTEGKGKTNSNLKQDT